MKLLAFCKRLIPVSIAAFLVSQAAFAVTFTPSGTPNLQDMLTRFSQDIPKLMQMVTAIAYVMGFFFVVKGLFELRRFGESRTMMSGEHHLGGPLTYLFVGAMLIYLPSTVRVGLGTFFGQSANPLAWQSSSDAASSVTDAVFLVIQLVGTISFIRGLVLLTQMGGGGHHQGVFGRAIAHIIAGILCINLYAFLEVMSTSLGIGQWSP